MTLVYASCTNLWLTFSLNAIVLVERKSETLDHAMSSEYLVLYIFFLSSLIFMSPDISHRCVFAVHVFSICDLISLKLCSLKVVLSISWTSSLLWKTFVFILMIFSHVIFLFHSNASILLNLFLLIGPHCWPL